MIDERLYEADEPVGTDVNLKDYSNSQYFLEVEVGTPGQKVQVALDTTTSDFWVESSKCWSTHCWFKHTFKGKKSSTYHKGSQDFAIKFLNNKVTGHVSTDKVKVGNVEATMDFGEITKVHHKMFDDKKAVGVLGLGYDSLSVDTLKSFMDDASVDDKSFSIYLHHDDKSYFVIPGMDTENWGVINTHKVAEKKYWALNIDYVQQGNGRMILADDYLVVLDSSTSNISGPEAIMSQLVDGIDVKDDCSNLSTLPDLVFGLNGIAYSVPASSYVSKTKKGTFKKKDHCELSVQKKSALGDKYIVLGDQFLMNYPAHFNLNDNTVSFMENLSGMW